MAVINGNSGIGLRWENAGVLYIYTVAGTDQYSLLNIVPGSLRWQPGTREGIVQMDRGNLSVAGTATVLEGDERPGTLSFQVKPTKAGMTSATELITLLRPASSAGNKPLYDVQVRIPTYRGDSTGTTATLTKCWMPDGEEYQAGGSGQNQDTLSITLQCLGGVAYATY